jgi:hypothetical protein
MRLKNKLGGALAALALVAALAAPAAHARPAVTCDPSAVPPPPSSIAASAAKEYELLRACAAHDDSTTVASIPVSRAASPPTGFDWVSAAIGGIVAAGLSLVFAAAVGIRRRGARPRRAAFSG